MQKYIFAEKIQEQDNKKNENNLEKEAPKVSSIPPVAFVAM